MALYYIVAIYNLGLLDQEKNRVNSLVKELISTAEQIDPSQNYFLHGISCSYVIETARITGNKKLISNRIINNLVESFYSMDKSVEDEFNRIYPFAYALTMLSGIGHMSKLFESSIHYNNQPPINWVIDNIFQLNDGEDGRLYMLNNSLINLMLRMRGNKFPTPRIFKNYVF